MPSLPPSPDRTCNRIFPSVGDDTKKGQLEVIAPGESKQGLTEPASLADPSFNRILFLDVPHLASGMNVDECEA